MAGPRRDDDGVATQSAEGDELVLTPEVKAFHTAAPRPVAALPLFIVTATVLVL
jgi:hypothetical protein